MEIDIGTKIRNLRKKNNITISQLSDATKLSTGLISQIERNMVSSSVESLWRISKALNVSIGYFFDEEPEIKSPEPIVRKDKRKIIKTSDSKAVYELLCPDLTKKIEFLNITLQPMDSNAKDLISHEGEEAGIIIKGKMLIKYGDKEYILNEGDSIYLDSTIPHRYINIGKDVCVSIWAMTPPSF